MSVAIEKHIERVKRDCLKQFKFEVSAFSILAVVILLCSYLFLISSLKTDRLSRMIKFETDIENRVLFQKSVATNLANLITKRSIQTKPKEIHKLLVQHFFLIKDGSVGADHFVIKWIGREPNGVEIDQFGVKGNNAIKRYDQVYSEQDIIKIVDSSGISHLMHQTCVAVLSGSGASVGNICIHQSANSMLNLAPLSDIKFVSLHEDVEISSFNTKNPYGLITLLERTPNVFLGKIKAISVISHDSLVLLWLESIWISLLVTLITGIVVIAKNYLSHKKTSKTLNLIAKQTEFIEKSTTAAIELQHNHMTKLQNLLFRTQGSIKLFMHNSQMAQDGMKLLSKLASDLICPYFSSSEVKPVDAKLLDDAVKNVVSVFMVAIEEMNFDVCYKVDPRIKELEVDLIFASRVIGCLINSSLEVLQNNGKVEMVINSVKNDGGYFLQITLRDNSFGFMPDKAKLMIYACVFPTIEEICAELIVLGGSISYDTKPYEGRTVKAMIPIHLKTLTNNVVSISDIKKQHT